MMKWSSIHKFLIIIGVLVIGMIWQIMSTLFEQYPLTNFPPKGTNIVALGDSLTVGIGASGQEGGFIHILEQRFNVTIINKGVSGNTTGDALARLDSDVLSYHPDIVMILLGSNDYLRQEPRKDTFKNLHTMITRIQEKGAVVILLGARGGALSDTFAKDFDALARSTGSAFVPGVLDDIFGNTKLMTDEVHPNDAGYLKMADKIAPALEGIVLAAPAQIKQ
jgi:lysophospholipase L1-like esterase